MIHQMSDVLVGSAIGFTTGYWLTKRHQRDDTPVTITPVVDAGQVGLFMRVVF